MKQCSKCKEERELEEFGLRKDSKDGRRGVCKDCSNARLKLRRSGVLDEELKTSRELMQKRDNLPEGIGYCGTCNNEFTITCNGRSKCQDCVNKQKNDYYMNSAEQQEVKKQYHINNREAITARKVVYYEDNAEHYKAKQKINGPIWAKANPAKCRARFYRYYARKLKASPSWLTKAMYDEIESYYEEAVRLEKETGVKYHVDHIYPLQGKTSCGLHVPWNLQVLTASENCSKSNKMFVDQVNALEELKC